MNETTYLLGMAQMLVEGGGADQNLARARRMIHQAREKSCKIVVLPECLDLGWTHPTAWEQAQLIPGKHSGVICSAARDAGIYVVAGLVEKSDDRLYNAAVLVSPEGEILLKHRKINELTIAHHMYTTGGGLSVVETPLGTIGVNICADNFPDSLALGHSLARMGCQILLSPCAWAVDADHDDEKELYGDLWMESYTALAKLYDITVVGVSNVGWLTAGPWEGRKCIGCSLAIGPGGKVLARGPYGDNAESLVVIRIEIKPPVAAGTAIADVLSSKGYAGP